MTCYFRLALALCAFWGLCCLYGCTTTPSHIAPVSRPLASAPVTIGYNGRPVIPVFVNGEGPYNFILDTASTKTAIFENLTRRMNLPTESGANTRVFSLAAVDERPLISIDSLNIGGVEISDARVVVSKDWRDQRRTPQGVIGLDVLSNYLLRYDADTRVLSFYEAGALPADFVEAEWSYAPLQWDSFIFDNLALIRFDAKIGNSLTFPLLLDTGAEVSIGNYPLLDMIPTISRPAEGVTDLADQQIKSVELVFYNMAANDVRWDYGSIYITDAQIFPNLGYGDRPLALVGFDLLGVRSFIMDFENLRFYAK